MLPGAPVGPSDTSLTAPTRLIRDLALGRLPALMTCTLNLVALDDLVDGLIAARDRGRSGERYLLTGEDVPIGELAGSVAELTGVPPPRVSVPYPLALLASAVEERIVAPLTGRPPGAPLTGVRLAGRQRRFDCDKARRELGYRPEALAEGLRQCVAWLRAVGALGPARGISSRRAEVRAS